MKNETLIAELTQIEKRFQNSLKYASNKTSYEIAMETMVHLPDILDALKKSELAHHNS